MNTRPTESPSTPGAAPAPGAAARPRRSRLASLVRKLGLLVASCVVAALLVEAVVLLVVGEQPKFPRRVVGAPWGLRYNEPGARYRHKSADVTVHFAINHQGMRADHDVPYQKAAGVKRIVSLGDSFTIGYEVEADKTFNAVLERDLNAAGIKTEVLNCGVSGFSNAEECLYLERELLKYDPDLVLVSFFPNDLVDNVRSGLFRLDAGRLAGGEGVYVPGGRLGNFVNTNPVLNILSEYSNAFVLVKERLNVMVKRRVVEQNQQNVGVAVTTDQAGGADKADPAVLEQQRLCAAIFERLYDTCRARNIPLVVQSIPWQVEGTLVDLFPADLFDTSRPGLLLVRAKPELDPHVGRELLYHTRSHWHWTPFCHEKAGTALARAILDRGLLP